MITQEKLKELFNYDNGKLIWAVSRQGIAKDRVAGHLSKSNGYTHIYVDGKMYRAHRLIFLYHRGYLPEFIDHKYGKEVGDYIWNLRGCTQSQNRMNSRVRNDSASGVKGVCLYKSIGKWSAHIKINGKQTYLGLFCDKKDAEQVVREKRNEIHGEFANHGLIR